MIPVCDAADLCVMHGRTFEMYLHIRTSFINFIFALSIKVCRESSHLFFIQMTLCINKIFFLAAYFIIQDPVKIKKKNTHSVFSVMLMLQMKCATSNISMYHSLK